MHSSLFPSPLLHRTALAVPVNQPAGFHYPIEDFLHGMVSLSNELSRLAVTAVIRGDYARPLRISAFLEELYNGFQLLNLKNDSLRKRFDSMKYDIKKIEEGTCFALTISLAHPPPTKWSTILPCAVWCKSRSGTQHQHQHQHQRQHQQSFCW